MCDSLLYFLNMRSLPVEIRTIVHYYFFPLCHSVSCGGYYMMRTKNEGLGAGFLYQFDQFKEEKKAGLYGSWSMHKGGGVFKASVTHLSLGLEGIFFCVLFFCAHLLCRLPPPPTPSYFPFFVFLTYSTSPCCVFLNQWTSHSEALWGFFVAHDFQGCLCSLCDWVSECVTGMSVGGDTGLLLPFVKEYVCTEILRSQWLLMGFFSPLFSYFSLS